MVKSSRNAVRRIDAGWSDVVLVCRKCSRKVDGGFGRDGETRLAKVLRRELGADRKLRLKKALGRRIAVIEVGCFGICPKGAVVAIRPGDHGGVVLARPRSAIADIVARLGFGPVPGLGEPGGDA